MCAHTSFWDPFSNFVYIFPNTLNRSFLSVKSAGLIFTVTLFLMRLLLFFSHSIRWHFIGIAFLPTRLEPFELWFNQLWFSQRSDSINNV